MKNNDKTLDQIYDLIAVRVIVETVSDCYTMLGLIHSIWRPYRQIQRLYSHAQAQYVSVPAYNVVTNFGTTFEIQIRTYRDEQYSRIRYSRPLDV